MAIDHSTSNFFNLTPDVVMNALESHGYLPTGRYRTLNSYENRVFDVDFENRDPLIIKFYRPNRWTQQAILEEHQFLQELKREGLPVGDPLLLSNNSTLCLHEGLWMAVFTKIRGRMIEEILPPQVPSLGRWLARLHNVGARRSSTFRPTLRPQWERLHWIERHIPLELWSSYRDLAEVLFQFLDETLPDFQNLRVHGDFHRGNLIWNQDWTLIDFDDHLMAPAAQDLWMIWTQLPREDQAAFLEAYQELRDWDEEEEILLEPLRAYRIVHYSTWIAERWEDPSFPHLFPNFKDYNFWSNELLELRKIVEPLL